MSDQNVELARSGYEAWNRGDLAAFLAMFHPDVEYRTSGVFPDVDAVYHGHEGLTRFWHSLREPWEAFSIDVDRIVDEDETNRVGVAIRFRAQGIGSGAKVDLKFGNAIEIRDGLGTRLIARRTLEEAIDALHHWDEQGSRSW